MAVMVLAQRRRHVLASVVWELPQPQEVHRHDRGGPQRGQVGTLAAFLHHIYTVLESAAQDTAHEMR